MQRTRLRALILVCLLLPFKETRAQSVILLSRDAVVWSQAQTVQGRVDTLFNTAGTLDVGGQVYPFSINQDSTFTVGITLGGGVTPIVASVMNGLQAISSDTLHLSLGYALKPQVSGTATVQGRRVDLIGSVLENPGMSGLSFQWTADPRNPEPLALTPLADSTATTDIAIGAVPGEYYFDLMVVSSEGDTGRARTCVTVSPDSLHAFDISRDHAAWIDSALIYEVSTPFFTAGGTFASVAKKIPELKELGVTALWLQPVTTTTEPCQGYHVLDYFSLRSDLGSEKDLHDFVDQAHAAGMRVMLDIVPNHTTIFHPYAQDAIQYGPQSHYYDFYQREIDTSMYAWAENVRVDGLMQFVYYFWDALVNLNYDSPEVRAMMIKAGQHWIEKYDIDGYRIDAIWGVDTRRAEFMQQWRREMKRIKPEVLLLGETKAPWQSSYDRRYDVAYDWSANFSWISLWAWGVAAGSRTNSLFSDLENARSERLRGGLTNQGIGFHPDAIILRYMENNDTERFVVTDGLARTRMVAALMFSVTGIPLLYNGQEVGWPVHPYSCTPIFQDDLPIRSLDTYGLFSYYQSLAALRRRFDALRAGRFEEIPVLMDRKEAYSEIPNGFTFAYRRWTEDQNIVCAINMADSAVTARLAVPTAAMNLDSSKSYYLTDLLTNEAFRVTASDLDTFALSLQPFTTRLFALADTVVITNVPQAGWAEPIAAFSLEQSYPNPFNATAMIRYSIPSSMNATLIVYDILGREIVQLAQGIHAAGVYSVQFDGSRLASGVYFYRLATDSFTATKRMILLR
jgi:cyclomaltodextrinase / maltogenic alpha-amylase / neopullulanase